MNRTIQQSITSAIATGDRAHITKQGREFFAIVTLKDGLIVGVK